VQLLGALHANLVLCIHGQDLGPVGFRDAMIILVYQLRAPSSPSIPIVAS
jgi:hypothetical protein